MSQGSLLAKGLARTCGSSPQGRQELHAPNALSPHEEKELGAPSPHEKKELRAPEASNGSSKMNYIEISDGERMLRLAQAHEQP